MRTNTEQTYGNWDAGMVMSKILPWLNSFRGDPAEYTTVLPLAVDSTLYRLQNQARTYFDIAQSPQARNGNVLGVRPIVSFVSDNKDHLKFISECTNLQRDNENKLRMHDIMMISCFAVSIAASCVTFLPFVGLLAYAAYAASVYYFYQRSFIAYEHKEALNLLVQVCNWSLGSHSQQENIVQNPEISAMMTQLYPLLTEDQVMNLIADEIEQDFVEAFKACKDSPTVSTNTAAFFGKLPASEAEKIVLAKNASEAARCVYGYNRGKLVDFFAGAKAIGPDLGKVLYSVGEKCYKASQSEQSDAAPANAMN